MSNLQLHEKKKQIIDVILRTYETGTLKICEILQLHENHKQLHHRGYQKNVWLKKKKTFFWVAESYSNPVVKFLTKNILHTS